MDDAASEALGPQLLAGVTGMEHLWREASSHLAESEPGTERWRRWDEALRVVTRALVEAEQVAAGVALDRGGPDRAERDAGAGRPPVHGPD